MDWIEIVVHTSTAASDAVSEALISAGADGTMVEDRADIPDPSKPNGIWEIIDPKMIDDMPEDVLVHAWFKPDAALPERIEALRARLRLLKDVPGLNAGSLLLDDRPVHDEDWSEVWKQFYKPFRAGRTLVVKPTWERWDASPEDRIIEIDPGMAFGSGMHETTSMCLAFLEDAVRPGNRVIDVGTGSGILAIGAALLGAGHVLAVDVDPTAVKVAAENIAQNGLQETVTAMEGNLLDGIAEVCDVCVANIIADVICAFARPLRDHIVPDGLFICSGIIKERENEVRSALAEASYELLEVQHKGEWVAMLARRSD